MNTARESLSGSGTATSSIAFGGEGPPSQAKTEDWNGVNWQETSDLNTARQTGAGSGGSTSKALYYGGANPAPKIATTEEWSGSSTTIKVLTD